MTIRRISLVLVLLAVAGAAAAEPVMLDLHDVSPLRDWHQRQNGNVRVILLLSPGCLSCIRGLAETGKILQRVADPRLRVAVVWMSVSEKDDRKRALTASSFEDGRLTYFWDPYRAAGETWQAVLKLRGAAWDVYLVYGAGSAWNVPDLDPGPPAFWMHQLKEVPDIPRFDPTVFEMKIRELLP